MKRRLLVVLLATLLMVAAIAPPAFGGYARPTIATRHTFLGIGLATHYVQPYWTWDSYGLLTPSHGGSNWPWRNIGISVYEYTPVWYSYPVGTKGFGVFYSKMRFSVGITTYGLPLGYDWYCQVATHCYVGGVVMKGETCSFNR